MIAFITRSNEVGPGHLPTNACGSGYSGRLILSFFWTTLTSFCACIIAAKLSVKLLCCLKNKKHCWDCLSQTDCYDQSSRRHTIKKPAELQRSPACFENTARAAILGDSTVVVVALRTRPRAIPLAMITTRKSIYGFLLVSYMGMGLRLVAQKGRRSSTKKGKQNKFVGTVFPGPICYCLLEITNL